MRALRLFLAVGIAVLAGCALKSPPARDEAAAQGMPNVRVPERWTTQSAAAGVVADRWLVTFNDPQLDALVQEALGATSNSPARRCIHR
jgi:outer membrane protein TolC